MVDLTNLKQKCLLLASVTYPNNDDAHKLDHYQWVVGNFISNKSSILEVLEKYPKELPEAAFQKLHVSILAHDAFASFRKHHESMAYHFAIRLFKQFGIESNIHDYAMAAKEHRASYTGEYTSILSEIVSAVDKGPLCINDTVKRALQYGRSHMGLFGDKLYLAVLNHVQEKFSREGYARMNGVWEDLYSHTLERHFKAVESLTLDKIADMDDHSILTIGSGFNAPTVTEQERRTTMEWLLVGCELLRQMGLDIAAIDEILKTLPATNSLRQAEFHGTAVHAKFVSYGVEETCSLSRVNEKHTKLSRTIVTQRGDRL